MPKINGMYVQISMWIQTDLGPRRSPYRTTTEFERLSPEEARRQLEAIGMWLEELLEYQPRQPDLETRINSKLMPYFREPLQANLPPLPPLLPQEKTRRFFKKETDKERILRVCRDIKLNKPKAPTA